MLPGSIYKYSFLRACPHTRSCTHTPTPAHCSCTPAPVPTRPHTAPTRPHCTRTPTPAHPHPHLHSRRHACTLHPHPCPHARTHTRTGVHTDTSTVTLEASTLAFTPSPASHTLSLACPPSLGSHPLADVEMIHVRQVVLNWQQSATSGKWRNLEKNLSITIAKLKKNSHMSQDPQERVGDSKAEEERRQEIERGDSEHDCEGAWE